MSNILRKFFIFLFSALPVYVDVFDCISDSNILYLFLLVICQGVINIHLFIEHIPALLFSLLIFLFHLYVFLYFLFPSIYIKAINFSLISLAKSH